MKSELSRLQGLFVGPLSVSVLHLMTLGLHAIQSLTSVSPCGEPHCDSMSKNIRVVLWALGTCKLHEGSVYVERSSLGSKHIVSIISNKTFLQMIPLVPIISKKTLKCK